MVAIAGLLTEGAVSLWQWFVAHQFQIAVVLLLGMISHYVERGAKTAEKIAELMEQSNG